MVWKFDSHKFYLTYAQCGELTWESIADVLGKKGPIKWARFGHEQHEDGGWHWHVCGEWTKRVQSRCERFLDVGEFHPNIQSSRSTAAVIAYVSKDGQFHDIGVVPVQQPKRTADEALALAGDPDERVYLRACIDAKISYPMAKRFRELSLQPKCPFTVVDYDIPDGVTLGCGLEYAPMPTNTAAVLVGPSGIGKTVWAQWICPKPAILISNTEGLKYFRPGYHRTMIFDDVDFTWMSPQQQIHLLDWHIARTINVKYGHVTIPAKTYKIFTNNCWPFLDMATVKLGQEACVQAIMRRITKIDLVC